MFELLKKEKNYILLQQYIYDETSYTNKTNDLITQEITNCKLHTEEIIIHIQDSLITFLKNMK